MCINEHQSNLCDLLVSASKVTLDEANSRFLIYHFNFVQQGHVNPLFRDLQKAVGKDLIVGFLLLT